MESVRGLIGDQLKLGGGDEACEWSPGRLGGDGHQKKRKVLDGMAWLQEEFVRYWFSTGDNFAPQETFGNIWKHFWLLQLQGATGIWRISRVAA